MRPQPGRCRMRICGLDPSLTNTGIAILDCTTTITAGDPGPVAPIALHSIGWGEEGGKTYTQRNRRGRAVASGVMSYIVPRNPDLISIEAPIPRGLARANQPDLWWLFGLLLAEADMRSIPVVVINPRVRQAWPTGNGNASKEQILDEVRTWWPVKILNADIADAAALASMAALRYGYTLPFPIKQRHWTPLIEKVRWPAELQPPPAPDMPEQLKLA